MTGATASADWIWRGLQTVILENRDLRVTILPELGGRIWSIVSKPHDREMLWHHPGMLPRPAPYGAPYDNWFAGGWDEVFPNDYPVVIGGESYPDHGEVWSLPAGWEIDQSTADEVAVVLEHRGVATDTLFRKRVMLRADESNLRVEYRIANQGEAALSVHWKSHLALPLTPGSALASAEWQGGR